jgi:L-ascorbate metabolism protein UlaG (beta-lactamase superfamily)
MPKYTNLDGTTPDKSLADLLRWNLVDRARVKRTEEDLRFTPPRVENDGSRLFAGTVDRMTWVGHATFLASLGGVTFATDPIWAERLGTVKRISPPGVPLGAVPALDVVTVSHNHYDHMDLGTLKKLARGRSAAGRPPTFVVPRDNADILHEAGIGAVTELGWWESTRIGNLRITLVPAQHWSMRLPWDRNQRLWGGFVYEALRGDGTVEKTAYHAGDTAFAADVFRAIGERFPAIDYAMLPIGAYDPNWFMGPQHMGPEEAVRAFTLLGAKTFCAMHWGTYRLTDEPLAEPPERLRAAAQKAGIDDARIWTFALGQTTDLTGETTPLPAVR